MDEDWFDGRCLFYSHGRICVGLVGHPRDEHYWRYVVNEHVVRTSHVQRLVDNAADLVRRVDGMHGTDVVGLHEHQRPGNPEARAQDVLTKAITDLRHAAAELEEEWHSTLGWAQV